ncbi:hypothetical protein PTTG_30612, partial [Puccinia triticina 1-1 BBBD Race 1]
MSTRRNSNVENLLPLSDPEAILRSGNAERRRLAQLLTTSSSRPNPQQPIEMSDTTPAAGGPEHSTESTQTTETADLTTAKDWFKRVLKLQHASVEQANEDRRRAAADRRADLQAFQAAIKANAARTNRLEEIIVGMHAKTDRLEEI